MFVNPFWFGVVTTAAAEFIGLLLWVAIEGAIKKKLKKQNARTCTPCNKCAKDSLNLCSKFESSEDKK